MRVTSLVAGVVVLLMALACPARAADSGAIEFTQETLANGLRVIYAPLASSPVVHVRVLYHVGSKDERPDRQGFAHMFEHMMFRGSAHVAREEHMRLIQTVGGNSNAFTSMDQTVYVNTVPAQHLEMALWLEADRMASFKVSDEILKTERNVVAEEWRQSYANRPYGTLYQDLMKTAFTTHSYRWMTIGDMDQLNAATPPELQAFFNTYYVPNNAVLVIAGKFDLKAAKAFVKDFYAWIPRGADVKRAIPAEPAQTAARQVVVPMAVPLYRIQQGYKIPPAKSADQPALELLGSILSGGRAGRLDTRLVSGKNPLCADVSAGAWGLEDGGLFMVSATVLRGQNPAEVETQLAAVIAEVRDRGVTDAELARAKTQARVGFIKGRETASDIASQLGDAALIIGDPNWANEQMKRIEAVTTADIQRVAKDYLTDTDVTTIVAKPGLPVAAAAVRPATAPAVAVLDAGEQRKVVFPSDYPTKAPLNRATQKVEFAKGTESTINGVKVIVMSDQRLPIVNWSLTMRRGGDIDPLDKTGLARLTAEVVRHGTKAMDYDTLNRELESRGLSVGMFDGGDFTRLSGSGPTDQAEYGIARSRELLLEPALDESEFRKVREQLINGLLRSEDDPRTVAQQELSAQLYPGSPLGRNATPRTVAAIELADVRALHDAIHRPNDAILVLSGDVTAERGRELAKSLLDGWAKADALPDAAYPRLGAALQRPRILLVDRPEGKQASIRAGLRAYTISSEDKFAGSLASQILSSGIDSRLGRAIRAERGLAYGVSMVFQPGRHDGVFAGGSETKLATTAELLKVMGDVFDKMKAEPVSDQELADAKLRVAGGMVMQMQTIGQQAGYRVDGILNNYPIDYYDNYPARVGEVTAGQIQELMKKYVLQNELTIVVVAPAEAVKQSLEEIGDVTVVPMPARRSAATQPAAAKPAA